MKNVILGCSGPNVRCVCMYVCSCMYVCTCVWMHICMLTYRLVRIFVRYVYTLDCTWVLVRTCKSCVAYVQGLWVSMTIWLPCMMCLMLCGCTSMKMMVSSLSLSLTSFSSPLSLVCSISLHFSRHLFLSLSLLYRSTDRHLCCPFT